MKNLFISIFVLFFLPISAQRTIITVQAGEALGNETWVYIKVADGKAWKANLATAATQAVGFVSVGGAVDDYVQVFLSGEIDVTTGLTVGSYYFLSSATPGTYTATQGAGAYQQLFKAISADRILIDIKATVSASGGGGMAIGDAVTGATSGSVLFAGASGVLAQDNASLFWDDTNNRLGIGTSSPGAKLDVIGNGRLYSTIGVADNVRTGIAHYDDSAVAAGIGGQLVLGFKYTGSSYTEGAIIKMYKLNATDGDFSTGLKFQVRNTGASLSTKMTLDPSGNVGIGTASPSGKFHIVDAVGSFDADNLIRFETTAGTIGPSMRFKAYAGGDYLMTATGTGNGGGAGHFRIYDMTGYATRFFIQATTGNVGIGTDSPTKSLTIGNSGSFGIDATNTTAGTTGARTINKAAGTVNFAAGATSITVTNSLVSTESLIFPVIRSNDPTAIIRNVVASAGSFTITLNAAATVETSVGFLLIN